jgi:hypothetical protein
MPTIIDGTAGITFPNSTVQASAGQVLQLVETANSTEKSTTSTTPVTTGISASITPKFSNSKIKVTVNITGIYSILMASYFSVYRNGTNLAPGGGTNNMADLYCNVANVLSSQTIVYIDSPASTSAQTYTLYFWASSGTCYTNLSSTNGYTTIVLEEIAG